MQGVRLSHDVLRLFPSAVHDRVGVHLACLILAPEIRQIMPFGMTYRILISESIGGIWTKARQQAFFLEMCYVLIPLLVPLLFVWIPLTSDAYGYNGVWCWIRMKDENCSLFLKGLVEQVVSSHAPIFILCSVDCTITAAILTILCKRVCTAHSTADSSLDRNIKENAPLLAYPILYQMFTWMSLTHWIYESTMQDTSKTLWYMDCLIPPLQGFLVTAVYTLYFIIWKRRRAALTPPLAQTHPPLRNYSV